MNDTITNYSTVTNFNELPLALTVLEAGQVLRVGRNVAYELVRSGQLRSVRVGKNIVGLVDLLELFLGVLIAGVQVGVVLFGQLAVGAFDLGIGGVFADPQHLVVITFFCHRIYPLYLWVVKGLPAEGKLSAQRTDKVGTAGDCP